MLNIVVPMAGLGSRYSKKGYDMPKPLIDVIGEPMIKRVLSYLTPNCEHKYIFIIRQEHVDEYAIDKLLREVCPGCILIPISYTTEGQASSVLLAKEYINNDEPLMIANCDQYVDIDINDYLQEMEKRAADGLIMTLKAYNDEWSYVKINDENIIYETVEKEVVSEDATVGIFNFARGKDYVYAAEKMIEDNFRVNNEFYVAPVYNYIIEKGKIIVPYNIGSVGDGMYGMGTPKELEWLKANCPDIFERRMK